MQAQPTDAPSLFDEPTAAEARDAALAQVDENANPPWVALAELAVRTLDRGATFTTDYLWRVLDANRITTHEPRALGAVMMRLARAGVIAKTGDYLPSTRQRCHARPIPVWRKLT